MSIIAPSRHRVRGPAAAAAAVLALAVLAALGGCSKDLQKVVIPNHPPEVRLTAAPIDTTGRYFYSITLNWTGWDPDGRVEYFLYAVDPPTRADAETLWVRTSEREKRLTFSAGEPDPLDPFHKAREFHVFVIKAVDDRGAIGPSVFRSFFAFTQAPTVQILTPRPTSLLIPTVTPATRITWSGSDVDGVFTIRPVRYRYKLFSQSDAIPLNVIASNPDTVRKRYAPAFAESLGWHETSADTTTAQFTNLTPGGSYVFVVVAFDEAGAYSPVMSLNSNVLRFAVGLASVNGPRICFFNEFFNYCYLGGVYTTSPLAEVEVEIPEGRPVTINWFATPAAGADMRSYRWALDITDVADPTPRADEALDLTHWSTRSLNVTSAVLGPFFVGQGQETEIHRFYLEAEDNNGLKSLGILRFVVVHPTFENELLIVDDTRRPADGFTASGTMLSPKGKWPSAAELDTFLYARGNVPWRGYPSGTLTVPGIFAGYTYDTLGTRIGRGDLRVPLAVLGRYKRVLWMVDGEGGFFESHGTDILKPQTALRYMSAPGRANSLGAYVRQGGLVWVAGGGVGLASTIPWNAGPNDGGGIEFGIEPIAGQVELGPGRFMYDIPVWRNTFKVSEVRANVVRFTGRFGDTATVSGRWGAPSPYATLPPALELKTRNDATEPLPPLRATGDYYQTTTYLEYLKDDNYVLEELAQAADATPVVISQVYAGGGEPGATWRNDFIELHNRSGTDVPLTGWSVQSAAGGNAWTVTPLSGTIPRGGYHLVRLGGGGGSGLDLPDAEVVGDVDLPMLGGKVALCTREIPLAGACPADPAQVMDLVGYGDTDCAEERPVRALTPTLAAVRRNQGCDDHDDNTADFAFTAPQPRNGASTRRPCSVVSVLDTLYQAKGGVLPGAPRINIVMTYYHGREHPPVIFSGFSLWNFRRVQLIPLVDYVMQNLWGLRRDGSSAAGARPVHASAGANEADVRIAPGPPRSADGTLAERFNRMLRRSAPRGGRKAR